MRQFAVLEFTVVCYAAGGIDPRAPRNIGEANLPVTRSNSTGYQIVIVTAIKTVDVC